MTTETTICRRCGHEFSFERPDGELARLLSPTVCGPCYAELTSEETYSSPIARALARNLPEQFALQGFETYHPHTASQETALVACRDHALEGVFLLGGPGRGKSHLAAAAIAAGPEGSLFVSSSDLLDDIKAGFDGASRGLYRKAKDAPLLALDDLGQEQATDFTRPKIYSLLSWRENHRLPLIVTSNITLSRLTERIGDGAASRLAGLCARRIEVRGPDMRRKRPPGGAAKQEALEL